MKKEFIGSYKKYLNDYINYKRNLGFKYGNPHEYKLLEFDKYMSENNITTLTLDSIHDFINSKDVSGNTKATTATLLRGFTKYLFNENVIDFILPERIYVAKRSKIPYIFTNEEINLFFETLKDFYPNCKFKNDIIFHFGIFSVFRNIAWNDFGYKILQICQMGSGYDFAFAVSETLGRYR